MHAGPRCVRSFAFFPFILTITACGSGVSSRVVALEPRRPATLDATPIYTYIPVYVDVPAGRTPKTVGFLDAVAGDADAATERLREDAAGLAADAVVEVNLRVGRQMVEVSGRAVRWH